MCWGEEPFSPGDVIPLTWEDSDASCAEAGPLTTHKEKGLIVPVGGSRDGKPSPERNTARSGLSGVKGGRNELTCPPPTAAGTKFPGSIALGCASTPLPPNVHYNRSPRNRGKQKQGAQLMHKPSHLTPRQSSLEQEAMLSVETVRSAGTMHLGSRWN